MKKGKAVHTYIDAVTHAGLAGKQNEDRYAVKSFFVGSKRQTPSTIAVLCDGIGGHRAGEVAAEIGVSIITKNVLAGDPSDPINTLKTAILKANRAIFEASQTNRGREGMGTTCACVWVIGDLLYTANLGDSRIYLMRKGHLVQLSTDHTWVQEAIDAGIILDGEGENHPNAHVIRRYLGSEKDPEPDFRLWFFENEGDADALGNQGFKLERGDLLMVCSDGLTDLVTDEEIRDTLMGSHRGRVPGILIDTANRRGGHDNITVILMSLPGVERKWKETSRKRKFLTGCLIGFILISLLATALVFGYRWWQGELDDMEKPLPTATQTMPVGLPISDKTAVGNPTVENLVTSQPSLSTVSPQPTRTPWPTNTASDG